MMNKKLNFNKRVSKKLADMNIPNEDIDGIVDRWELVDLTLKQMSSIELLIDKAKDWTRVTEARIGLINEWLYGVIYGDVTEDEKRMIDIHLKDMEKAYTLFMGTDCTTLEKNNYRLYCIDKVIAITNINEGFGNSIKIQLE